MSIPQEQTEAGPLEEFKAMYWQRYSSPMSACERRLAALAGRPGRTLGESCGLTLSAGGKRLRPLLVFLSTREGAAISENQQAAAAAVELVHMATLVHDDVLDGAEMRRGLPTLVSRYGRPVSLAAGDYLFSTAFEVLSGTGSAKAVAMLASASLGLSRGELSQMAEARNLELTREAYIERCTLKTANLFSASCRLGALFSGCSDDAVGKLGEFGRCLGLAFQIFDDILDFTGQASRTGKKTGADLRDGTITLPLVFALKKDSAISEILKGEPDEEAVSAVCERVAAVGGLDEAREEAVKYVYRAKDALAAAGGELETGPLALIASSVVDRDA